jgi:hypothetical protein
MKHLFPALSSAKANVVELERLRASQTQLELQGIHPMSAGANFPLLTAKLSPKEISSLKALFPRRGFVDEIASLEKDAKEFAAQLTSKAAAAPSAAWKLMHSAKPEAVLWAAHTSKAAAVQNKFKAFYTEWPQAKLKLPYALMQEMRIVPGVPRYDELLEKLFFELMDGKLTTVEEMKAYLEPYSPPAPPPPVNLRKARAAAKKEAKVSKKKKEAPEGDAALIAEASEVMEGMDDLDATEMDDEMESVPPVKGPPVADAPVKGGKKTAAPVKAAAESKVKAPAKAEVKTPVKVAAKKTAAPAKAPVKAVAKKAPAPAKKPVVVKKAAAKPAKLSKPAAKIPVKAAKKAAVKAPAKKIVAKKAPAKKAPAKAAKKKR